MFGFKKRKQKKIDDAREAYTKSLGKPYAHAGIIRNAVALTKLGQKVNIQNDLKKYHGKKYNTPTYFKSGSFRETSIKDQFIGGQRSNYRKYKKTKKVGNTKRYNTLNYY